MPPQGTPLISSFFKKAAPASGSPAAGKKRHVVELSSDEEEHIADAADAPAAEAAGPGRSSEGQPPAKVARTSTGPIPRPTAQERQELAERKAAAKAAQREEWSFKPSQAAPHASGSAAAETARGALLPSPSQASKALSSSQRAAEPARRRELRKRLLGPEDPLARLTRQGREAASDEEEDTSDAAVADEANEAGPSNRFGKYAAPSGAAKTPAATAAKGRSGSTSKKKGDEYTPLEKQILALKEENPGVLLAVEVGYKVRCASATSDCTVLTPSQVKFYNEDARIAARELSIMCYPDNHLVRLMHYQ
jgi:DNA mismatch repair protein MSH3